MDPDLRLERVRRAVHLAISGGATRNYLIQREARPHCGSKDPTREVDDAIQWLRKQGAIQFKQAVGWALVPGREVRF